MWSWGLKNVGTDRRAKGERLMLGLHRGAIQGSAQALGKVGQSL